MNNKLSIAAALVAGLAGGVLTRYIAPPPVFAQTPSAQPAAQEPIANEVRARSFTLVDQFDDAMGTFTVEPVTRGGLRTQPNSAPNTPGMNTRRGGPMRVVLRDSTGNEIWSASAHSLLQPAAVSLK